MTKFVKTKQMKDLGKGKRKKRSPTETLHNSYEDRFRKIVCSPSSEHLKLMDVDSTFPINAQTKFLQCIAATGSLAYSLREVGVSRNSLNKALNEDTEFSCLYEEALFYASDMLELEARRRAVDGVEKGVYYQGELVDYEKQYSDRLLDVLLKANKANKFANRTDLRIQNNDIRYFSEMVALITAKDSGEDVSQYYTMALNKK